MEGGCRVAVIIPARLESRRLPRKLLLPLGGRPVLACTHARAAAATGICGVWVATDSDEIEQAARAFGAQVLRTGVHSSGSDRVGAALECLQPTPDAVINLQGDEALLDPAAISRVAAALGDSDEAVVTCGAPLPSEEAWRAREVVKVVLRGDDRALYFSRAPIPGAARAADDAGWQSRWVLQHVGIYGYPVRLLRRFLRLPATPLERIESLEQLRMLEAGIPLRVIRLAHATVAIDTSADLRRARAAVGDAGAQDRETEGRADRE
ncbi:MAG: 3-deoxy-manno-octulosonate cytidylyltransferase [Candidatus Eisenbacteria bacterium]|nr:3-deoxy-manno-octulosonate cytidylyltransferase [Candidatus Eisenbacteria bacterium]